MTRVRAGTVALLVVSLPVLVGIFIYGPFVLDLFLHRRPPSLYLIPSGYIGWVKIEYRVPSAPPLPREGKYLLLVLDGDGSLQTSSNLPTGWAHDRSFYYSGSSRQALSNAGWCKGGMIWGEDSRNARKVVVQKFFVGAEDQFRMEVDPAGETYGPCG